MAAPTWTAEDEEHDDLDRAEKLLLERFLFRDPVLLDGTGRALGTPLRSLQGSLEPWLRMITGLPVIIGQADPPCTDLERLYLPLAAPEPPQRIDALLYRALSLVQLGFWQHGLLDSHATLKAPYKDWVLRSCWHLLAARWVLAEYGRDFPGIANDLERLRGQEKGSQLRVNLTPVPWEGLPRAFLPLYQGLCWMPEGQRETRSTGAAAKAVATIESVDSAATLRLSLLGQARLLREHFKARGLGPPPLPWFVGIIRPEWILRELEDDPEHTNAWMKGPAPLQSLLARTGRKAPFQPEAPQQRRGFRARLKARLTRGKEDLPDVGSMPAYGVLRDEAHAKAKAVETGPPGLPSYPGDQEGFRYDEWDSEQGCWRLDLVHVSEPPAPGGSLSGYTDLAKAHAAEILQIKRRFEALRTEERWVGGLPEGPEIDIDRAILARTDILAGQTPDPRVYRQFIRRPEPLCVMTLVDLSGSTQGRVLHAQQRALVLFAEGLRSLSLAHAFYGFNGERAAQVNMWRLKDFEEGYEEEVFRRMGNLRAQGATRLGAILRHATHRLRLRPEGKRLLILISDGRPEDRDGYRGERGVADSAMAVQEAARAGVHVHCISLDKDPSAASEYLKPVFGAGRFLVVPKVEQLAMRLPELFVSLV